MTLTLKAIVNVDAKQAQAELGGTTTALKELTGATVTASEASKGDAASVKAMANMAASAAIAVKGLGAATTSLTAQQLAVSGATRAFKVDMAQLAPIQVQAAAETERQVQELILLEKSFQDIAAAVAPAITAEERLAEVQRTVAAAVNAGLATQEQATVVAAQAARKFGLEIEHVGTKSALSYMQVQELGHVTRSVAGVMMMGGSALQAFQFEASRIASVLAQGGGPVATIKSLGSAALSFLGPFKLGALAVGALALAFYEFYPRAKEFSVAIEDATKSVDDYSKTLTALQTDMTAAEALEAAYTEAVKSGSAQRIAVVKDEARIRSQQLVIDLLDQVDAQKTAAKAMADAQESLAATQARAKAAQANVNSPHQVGDSLITEQKVLQDVTAELEKQQRAYDKASLSYQLVGDQITLTRDKEAEVSKLVTDIASGTITFASGTAGAAASSVGLATQLQGVGQWALVAANHVAGFTPALNSATAAAGGLAGAMGGVAMAANAALSQMIQMEATRQAGQDRVQAVAAGFVGRPEQTPEDLVAARAAANRAKAQIIAKANADAIAASSGTSGGGATKQATNEVQAYIDKLKLEQEVMQTTDPVQQEMLKNRKMLAQASVEQRAAIEELLTAQQKEANLTDTMKAFGQATYDALSGLIIEGKSASDVMKGLEKAILQAALQALVLGEGPLAGIFGTKGTSLISLIFGGKKADGGMIYGAGGARDDKVMIAASAGEYVVNGRAANANRPLLDYINGGGQVGGYASGGTVGGRVTTTGGGSAGAVVSMPIHIDARGAQVGVAEQIAAKFQELAPQISQIAVVAVAQARSRGYAV